MDNMGNCIECQNNYYLAQNKCKPVSLGIIYCQVYYSDQRCEQCQPGYILSKDRLICMKAPQDDNCVKSTNFYCNSCRDGFLLVQNDHSQMVTSYDSRVQFDLNLIQQISKVKLLVNGDKQVCSQIMVRNCQVYQSVNECKICQQGFYLDDFKSCSKYPDQKIVNCVEYKNSKSCQKCKLNFYILNDNCVPAIPIQNCL